MLQIFLALFIARTVAQKTSEMAREAEDRREKEDVDRMLKDAELYRLNKGRMPKKSRYANEFPTAPRNPAVRLASDDLLDEELPRRKKKRGANRNLYIILAVVGGLVVVVLFTCFVIALGIGLRVALHK